MEGDPSRLPVEWCLIPERTSSLARSATRRAPTAPGMWGIASTIDLLGYFDRVIYLDV
jgi:hypothetical protein